MKAIIIMQSDGMFLGEEAQRDIREFYEVTKNELGKGSYGIVQLGKLKGTSIQRAIKIIDKSKVSNVERFRLEVEIMMKLDHPSILRLYDYFEDQKCVYLVLELCSGGELFDRIIANKFYNETDARVIFSQIIQAIYYCHLNGVCHRDLKPENFIMVSKKDPFLLKVIDFGLSRTFDSSANMTDEGLPKVLGERAFEPNSVAKPKRQSKAVLKTKAGTPFYIAPEVLTGSYNEKCDVWSCGVILYILFCGYPPFYGENNKEILESVKKGKLEFSTPEWKDKGKTAIDIIKRMITGQETRLFADEVLAHPWMNERKQKPDNQKLKDILKNMTRFSDASVLVKTVAYFISKNSGEEELVEFHEPFSFFDNKKIGSISVDDFKKAVKSIGGMTDPEAETLFKSLNILESPTLPYSLFAASSRSLTDTLSSENLQMFFSICDIDRNDKLTLSDMESFLKIQFKYIRENTKTFQEKVLKDMEALKIQNLPVQEFVRVLTLKKN